MTQDPLSPDQQAVRRLLAEARHDAPMPPEVVARLEERLAELVGERGAVDSPVEAPAPVAPVVDLAARRRRRRASLVLAAAAVVVAGFAVPGMLQGGDDSASVDAGADTSVGGSALDEDAPEAPSPGASTDDLQRDAGSEEYAARDRLVEVSSDTAARDLRRVRDRGEVHGQATVPLSAADIACVGGPAAVRERRLVPITWDGVPAVASFAEPRDGRQLVEVHTCEGGAPVTAVWLSAR